MPPPPVSSCSTYARQVAYCALVGTFPFNSFLAGFLSCVGVFALTGKWTFMYFAPSYV